MIFRAHRREGLLSLLLSVYVTVCHCYHLSKSTKTISPIATPHLNNLTATAAAEKHGRSLLQNPDKSAITKRGEGLEMSSKLNEFLLASTKPQSHIE
jgi:hypothetical protein